MLCLVVAGPSLHCTDFPACPDGFLPASLENQTGNNSIRPPLLPSPFLLSSYYSGILLVQEEWVCSPSKTSPGRLPGDNTLLWFPVPPLTFLPVMPTYQPRPGTVQTPRLLLLQMVKAIWTAYVLEERRRKEDS